jgi:hypothetical protein
MVGRLVRTRREDRIAAHDELILADGQVMRVTRTNLAAAKAAYAAQRAAKRRMAARPTWAAAAVVYDLYALEADGLRERAG